MFGMEQDKSKKDKDAKGFSFDLEKELTGIDTQKEYAKQIQNRISQIKEILRKGTKKDEYDQLGVLLSGYHALAIVLARVVKKKK